MITNLLWRHKYLLFIALFIISCNQDPCKMIYGRWKFYKYTPINTIGCLTDEEFDIIIPYFIDKEIEIHKEYILLDNKRFENPIYELTEEDIYKFLIWGYQIENRPTDLGIQENVNTVKVLNIYVEDKYRKGKYDIPNFVSPFQKDVGMSFSFSNIIVYENELLIFFAYACFHLRKVK